MTVRELLQKIEDLKKANLLRDESHVGFVCPEEANPGDDWKIQSARRESADRLTFRA